MVYTGPSPGSQVSAFLFRQTWTGGTGEIFAVLQNSMQHCVILPALQLFNQLYSLANYCRRPYLYIIIYSIDTALLVTLTCKCNGIHNDEAVICNGRPIESAESAVAAPETVSFGRRCS